MGIGDWGLGPIPNPQSPIPNPQSPISLFYVFYTKINYDNYKILNLIFQDFELINNLIILIHLYINFFTY